MANNLTSKEILDWKLKVNDVITDQLIKSLKAAAVDAMLLCNVTNAVNDNQLSRRFNDLHKVTTQASTQLTTFMKAFHNNLNTYIRTVQKAEAEAAEKVRQKVDQFEETAENISKLKM